MPRKIRIAVVGALIVSALIAAILSGAYYAARQVRPFYEQALRIEPEVMERGNRELESRASALYSDAKQIGQWRALFTAQQINSWFATQQAANKDGELFSSIRDARVAVARDCLTVGFRTKWSGVETVVSIDASVMLMEDGALGIRLLSARAGTLPLPVMQAADFLASVCKKRNAPVRWTQQKGLPVAIVNITSNKHSEKRQFFIDSIELRDGEMYVAGHTEVGDERARMATKVADSRGIQGDDFALDEYELRLIPDDENGALEIARRPAAASADKESSTTR